MLCIKVGAIQAMFKLHTIRLSHSTITSDLKNRLFDFYFACDKIRSVYSRKCGQYWHTSMGFYSNVVAIKEKPAASVQEVWMKEAFIYVLCLFTTSRVTKSTLNTD